MARLIWSPRALKDLNDICEYIARDSEKYARVFAERAVEAAEASREYPDAGSIVPEHDRKDLRERLVYNYRVIYRFTNELVELVTICHGARTLHRIRDN